MAGTFPPVSQLSNPASGVGAGLPQYLVVLWRGAIAGEPWLAAALAELALVLLGLPVHGRLVSRSAFATDSRNGYDEGINA